MKVNNSIHDEWLQWQQQVHIPEIMATGCFEKYQLSRILDIDDADGPTYAVQYYVACKEAYNRYIEVFASNLRQQALEKWGSGFVGFRTLMQVVH